MAIIETKRIFSIFNSEEELMHQLGVKYPSLLLPAIVKELIDNAIDAGASAIKVEIKANHLNERCFVAIEDNGKGLPTKVIKMLHPAKFVSSKRLARRPERGRKGNALITIIGILSLANKSLTIINQDGRYRMRFIPDPINETFMVKSDIDKTLKQTKGTRIEFDYKLYSPNNEKKTLFKYLFALILLNPDKYWEIHYNGKLILRHTPKNIAKSYDKNKYLDGDIFWYTPKEFYQKLVYERTLYPNLRCRAWIKQNFLRMTKRKLPLSTSKKLSEIKEKEAIDLFKTLRAQIKNPPSSVGLWHIGEKAMKETFYELLPFVEIFSKVKKEAFIGSKYAIFYPNKRHLSPKSAIGFE